MRNSENKRGRFTAPIAHRPTDAPRPCVWQMPMILPLILALGACETTRPDDTTQAFRTPTQSVERLEPSRQIAQDADMDSEAAVYGISQIAEPVEDEDAIFQRQIPESAIMADKSDRLSVAQLKTYADRCGPGVTPPSGVDCSNLALRVERLFRSDDEVARALTVLDRLALREPEADTQARLFVQRAIASGALLVEEPEVPEPDNDELTPDVGSTIGAIISATGRL